MKYYHISEIVNKKSILKDGLKSIAGEIFVFTAKEQATNIAFMQLFISEYSLFEINSKGITGKKIKDAVTERGAHSQIIILQSLIEPNYIIHLEDCIHNEYDLAEDYNRKTAKALGYDEEKFIEMLLKGNKKWAAYYKKKYKL